MLTFLSITVMTVLPSNGKLVAETCQNYTAQPGEVNVCSPFLPSSPYMGLLPLRPASPQRNFVNDFSLARFEHDIQCIHGQ